MARVAQAVGAAAIVLGASASAVAAPPLLAHDVQEANPDVGLFRLPAHRGGADALAGPEGFGFLSKSGDFGMMFHPVLQADVRLQTGDLADEADRSRFLVAFAGFAIAARIYERIRSELLMGFSAGSFVLSQAWIDAGVAPWLHLKVGQFPSPLGFERTTASIFLPLVAPTLVSVLLPSADTGAELWGTLGDSALDCALALVTGAVAGAAASPPDAEKTVVGRVAAHPFARGRGPRPLEGLVFGVGASAGEHSGSKTNPALPRLSTWAGRPFFAYRTSESGAAGVLATGASYRLVPQASWHAGPVSVYTEVARTHDEAGGARVASTAFAGVMTTVLTGEKALPLHYVIPSHPLDLRGGHVGAIEVVASGSVLDVRDDGQLASRLAPGAAMRGARTMAAGLNWYPYLGIRVMLDAEHTSFRPTSSVTSLPNETLVVGRFQLVL